MLEARGVNTKIFDSVPAFQSKIFWKDDSLQRVEWKGWWRRWQVYKSCSVCERDPSSFCIYCEYLSSFTQENSVFGVFKTLLSNRSISWKTRHHRRVHLPSSTPSAAQPSRRLLRPPYQNPWARTSIHRPRHLTQRTRPTNPTPPLHHQPHPPSEPPPQWPSKHPTPQPQNPTSWS